MMPGGAVLEGESPEEAAARLLWDQTGVGDIDVGPCVWLRTNLYPWDGKVYKHQERYFPVVVEEAEVTDQYWDDVEKKVLRDFRWWSLEPSVAAGGPKTLQTATASRSARLRYQASVGMLHIGHAAVPSVPVELDGSGRLHRDLGDFHVFILDAIR